MDQTGLPLPREDLKNFLQSLSRGTDLSMTYIPPGSNQDALIIGESSFCLQLKTSTEGARRCSASLQALKTRAAQSLKPEFDLCHARMGEVVVPLVSDDGRNFGTVVMGHALVHGLSDEHKNHIKKTALEIGLGATENLLAAASSSPVFTRSRLEALGGFIQRQLVEKASSQVALEDTTQYLFEKYEELMFLYAITESLSPERGHEKVLAVILDKGVQKLGARWGLFLMEEEEEKSRLAQLEACGTLPWPAQQGPGAGFMETIDGCDGPCHVLSPGFRETDVRPGAGHLLVIPFQLRNLRRGYLVFGWEQKEMVGDAEFRFALALSRQATSVLYVVQLYQELADLLFATLEALSSAIDAKDPYTHGHSRRVAEYAVMTAQMMAFDTKFITMLKIAGQLHDFGKIGVREHILGKQGRLTESEKKAMEEHPVIGAHILGKFRSFADIVPGIRHHHEHYDGRGYPDGLQGQEIPLVGRIIAVADAYDAMMTNRPYRARRDHQEALMELQNNAGSQFDPQIVEAFANAIGRAGHG